MTKLPKKPKAVQPSEQQITELINKGGSTPADTPPARPQIKQFPLRLPPDLYDRTQRHGKSLVPTKTVTTFIIEAILEKLDRDGG